VSVGTRIVTHRGPTSQQRHEPHHREIAALRCTLNYVSRTVQYAPWRTSRLRTGMRPRCDGSQHKSRLLPPGLTRNRGKRAPVIPFGSAHLLQSSTRCRHCFSPAYANRAAARCSTSVERALGLGVDSASR
jgi:hypothetical protein